jgi:hypothetical protein
MNFKKFFSLNSSNPQHRSIKRITDVGADRKHQNIVAKSQGTYQYKDSALDDAELNKSVLISNTRAQSIANKYGLNIEKENTNKPFQKQLKDSGKFLVYIPNKGYYIKSK